MKDKENKLSVYGEIESSMRNNHKRITTSKIWLVVVAIIFIASLIFCLLSIATSESIFDTTVYVTTISVTGAIFGSSLVWYSKKSTSENHYKLRLSMYEDIVNQRLYFTEEMLKLKQKYNANDEDIMEIDSQGEIDDIMDESIVDMKSKMDMDRDEAESSNEIQTFGL